MLYHIPSNSDKANVLIIMTDQQRSDAIGYIDPLVQTPNLNALAQRSTICTNTFVQSPQCQPSRASILTGRYPTAHKVWWNETQLPSTEVTIANIFKKAGYATAYFGKLHVDGTKDHTSVANHFGFSHTYLQEDWQNMIGSRHETKSNKVKQEFYGPMSKNTWTGTIADRTFHHEDIITDKAIQYLNGTPIPNLTIVSYYGPHPPYAAPLEFSKLYDKSTIKPPSKRNVPNFLGHVMTDEEWIDLKLQYYASISWIDDNIGRLLANVSKDTIVVFMSDHGDILGDHGYFSKGIYAYDGNIKIPMLISAPQLPHATYPHLVQAIDLLPTLLDLCGIKQYEGIQGSILSEAIKNNRPHNEYVISMLCHALRLRMIRTQSYKYWIQGRQEFYYDLIADPTESNNLASDQSSYQKLSAARFALLKALINCEDPLPSPRQIKS